MRNLLLKWTRVRAGWYRCSKDGIWYHIIQKECGWALYINEDAHIVNYWEYRTDFATLQEAKKYCNA